MQNLSRAFKNTLFARRDFRLASSQAKNFATVTLSKNSNQARGLAEFAIDFVKMDPKRISEDVYDRVRLFHTDSVICGVSAIALRTNAPNILRDEAINRFSVNPDKKGKRDSYVSKCIGSKVWVHSEKAIVSNVSAVREWDANGTMFGYNPNRTGHDAGEFGHNDYYPVVIAACHNNINYTGRDALKGMILLDEIRGRLAEVFSLKTYKIDHVVHGAIASTAVYGAMMGATADQIERAIGMVVAHYVPWRAIRSGEQLSDSKGASAALSTEVAIQSIHRTMNGFIGPQDIFRNPNALFRQFKPTEGDDQSPFDIVLKNKGDKFAVMDMHFKLGLYEHQSSSAIEGLLYLLSKDPKSIIPEGNHQNIERIKITSYEPALGIIGDPAKKNPLSRQTADHSMVYIISTLLRKACEKYENILDDQSLEDLWKYLMLTPFDYSKNALFSETTRAIMEKIEFQHGGLEYDQQYPRGIPTSVQIVTKGQETFDSGIVMFPAGHSRNKSVSLHDILQHKFKVLGKTALDKQELIRFVVNLENIIEMSNEDLWDIYDCNFKFTDQPIDEPPR